MLLAEAMAIDDRVKKIIAEHLGVDLQIVTDGADLFDDFKADSLDRVELLFEFEGEFGACFRDDDMDGVRTVADVIRAVTNRLNATPARAAE